MIKVKIRVPVTEYRNLTGPYHATGSQQSLLPVTNIDQPPFNYITETNLFPYAYISLKNYFSQLYI